jgi:hypothetical protein
MEAADEDDANKSVVYPPETKALEAPEVATDANE